MKKLLAFLFLCATAHAQTQFNGIPVTIDGTGVVSGIIDKSHIAGNGVRYSTTNITLVAGDGTGFVVQTGSAAFSVSIAQSGSAGFPAGGYYTVVVNRGTGTGTFTPTTSTVNSVASYTIPAGQSVLILTDNTTAPGNYLAVPWGTPSHLTGAGIAPTLSACGTSPSITGAMDTRGTVTEGTASTGCVITFNVQFSPAPVCTVTSPGGFALTSYSVSTSALTLVNASSPGNTYSYVCIQ